MVGAARTCFIFETETFHLQINRNPKREAFPKIPNS